MAPVLQATGVHVRYRRGPHALRGVDLAVDAGECVVLVGESGSGKSTLLKTFNRLVEPVEGEVRLHGKPLRGQDKPRLRRRIGYVQQEGGLLPHWTVEANVALVPRLLRWKGSEIGPRVVELLQLVGLPPSEFAGRYPRSLSGGQRQRVAFARALAARPDVVLLDEPFGALDPIRRAELQDEFVKWTAALGATTLLVTHDLAEALRLGDRVAVLREGLLEQVATPRALVSAPATDYVAHLLERAGVAS